MGYNTTILFLNDYMGDIQRNPEKVVEAIHKAISNGGRMPVNLSFGMRAMPTEHADVARLYMTHGNNIVEFGPYQESTPMLKYRKEWAKKALEILKDEEKEIKRLEAELNNNA